MLQLVIEGGAAIAIFIRCFADKKGLEHELLRRLHIEFPRGVLAAIAVGAKEQSVHLSFNGSFLFPECMLFFSVKSQLTMIITDLAISTDEL